MEILRFNKNITIHRQKMSIFVLFFSMMEMIVILVFV